MQKILLLEDNPLDADLVGKEIKKRWPKLELITVSRLSEARKLMQDPCGIDIALFDLKLPDGNGMDLLSELREQNCDTPIIIFTSEGSEEIATTALKTGANDYFPKTPGFHKKVAAQIEFTYNQNLTSRQHLSVLYVEHNKADVDLTIHYLKKYAPYIHLTIASNGEEVLKLLPDNRNTLSNFDLLLLDYNLPGLNALEISKIIRQERKLSIAMVIVTGQGDENIAVEALKIGIDDYICKHKNYLLRLPSVLISAYRRRELERTGTALRNSEERLIKAQKVARMGFIDWNLKTNELELSDEVIRLYGLDPNQKIIGPELLPSMVPPEDAEKVKKNLEAAINGDKKYSVDHRIIKPDGDIIWVQTQAELIEVDGVKESLLGTIVDITDRKKAEEDLQESEANLREAQQIAKIGRWELDLISNNLEWAPIIFDIFEIDQKKFGASYAAFLETIHPDDRNNVDAAFTNSLKNKTPYEISHRLRMKDGRLKWVLEKGKTEFDKEGKAIRTIGIVQDITEIKQAEQKLRDNETKYRLLADYAADWEYWINPQGEYIFISPACEKTSGYPPSAFEKNKCLLTEITLPEYHSLVEEHFLQKVKSLHKPIEFQILTKEGKVKWISHFCQPVYDDDNNYAGKRGVNRDITEQKQAELELRQSEARFKRLFEDLGDAVYVTRIGKSNMGDILEVNSAAVKQSGYSKEELLKMNIINDLSIQGSSTGSSSEYSDNQLVKGGSVSYIEKKRRKNGEEYWTEIIITPIEFKGELAGLSINRDITERKKAEEVLLKMNTAIKNAGDVIFMTDKEGIITFINPEFTKMYGYSAEEVVGKTTPRILKSGELKKEELEYFWNAIQSNQELPPTQYRNKCKNGKLIDIESSVDTILDDAGEVIGFLAIQRDISERKRAEKIQEVILNISNATQDAGDLQETMKIIQKELGSLMDTTNFLVALYDEDFDKVRLLYYQDEKDEITEFPVGRTLTGLVIKEGKPLLIDSAKVKRLEEEEKIEKVGFESVIWLGVPLKTKGKVSGAFVVQSYTDANAYTEKDKEILEIISHQISISIERKREEEKLLAALEAAKESDRIKTAFLANMSHELRTPLNAVIGFSSLMDKDTEPVEIADYAQLINKSGNNLLEIVDEIFEMTLIDRGEQDLNRSKLSVSQFLNDIYQTILHRQKNQENTGVTIEQEILGIGPYAEAFTDFNKLKQVFLYVLGNAIKFTHKGYIRFGVFPSETGNDFVFYVKDTGIGIKKEKQQTIFERFKIADESLTRKYSGIGAGLYISKNLITLLGGEIWVESELESGSTFYFTIPQ